ncbi:hypothetical protein PsorP6_009831 [Peronosclerospora sorghi]|uniref:Uncharacterized protein n=1 Tax=Peronosclerospora sorghi TaxID=230839 RepID=A0ACC0VZY8_9STRA|nr:hypothetical protein PsorP6_009831 [Peronosclerospora sorghi]
MHEDKMSTNKFPANVRGHVKTTEVLQLLNTDLMGPMSVNYQGNARYVLTFIDDYSHFVVILFLKVKSEQERQRVEYQVLPAKPDDRLVVRDPVQTTPADGSQDRLLVVPQHHNDWMSEPLAEETSIAAH